MPTLKNGDICASSPFFELNIDQLYVGTQVASAKPDLCFVKDKMVNKYFFFEQITIVHVCLHCC